MIKKPCVAVVLLNYNSEEDLFVSAEQINNQINVDLITIIIDNASSSELVNKLQLWSKKYNPDSFSGSSNEILELTTNKKLDRSNFTTFFIYNNENKGYSAGNNIGIRLADYLNVDTVLIANPDMRFENENYIYELSKTLFSNEKYLVAASKVIGLDGKDQNPLREASFLEELFWPRIIFPSIFKNTSYILPYKAGEIVSVPKITGCCLLLRMDFLRNINYFDENTFLYSEEPILSVQVKQHGGEVVFTPFIEAVHAHKTSEKGNNSKRMLLMIKSRRYYLKKYSGYSQAQLMLLNFSYSILSMLHKIKYKVTK
jgi:GT2 family glycosyltransferase